MEKLTELICGGADGFTPELLVRLFLFVMVLDCIAMVARALLTVGRR